MERLDGRVGWGIVCARLGAAHAPVGSPGRVTRRILILSWEYPPIVEGGLARHVRKLSEGLVRRGVAVHVLTCGRESDLPEEVRAMLEGWTVLHLGYSLLHFNVMFVARRDR